MFLSILAALQIAAAPTIADDGTITVTSTRLPDLAAAEAACRETGCPVRQDVAATVAYASKLFEDGSYVKAKQALVASIGRVRLRSAEAPLVVAQLYAATAKLAEHEGDQDLTGKAYERGLILLRDHLPQDDTTRLSTEVRYGDWLLSRGQVRAAKDRYRAAIAGGNVAVADAARLRLAQVLARQNARSEADTILRALATAPDPYTRQAALAVQERLARDAGNRKAAAAAGLALATATTDVPMLVSAPPFPQPGQLVDPRVSNDPIWGGGREFTDQFSMPAIGLLWVDVAYRINPDGNVSDVRIVRGSSSQRWAAPILAYVAGRRYTATAEGRERIERYSYTADYGVKIGSLIRRRIVAPHFVMAELSDKPIVATGSAS